MNLDRHAMYTAIFTALPLPLRGNILGVSGLKYFIGSPHYTPPCKVIADDATITETDYPAVNICAMPYTDNTFDYVIADMVIEHVEGNPQKVFDEIRRVLKPGGIAIVTSVFMYRIHWGPKDLWRFSPDALRYLARDWSHIIQASSWGNRWMHICLLLYRKTVDIKIPSRKWSLIRKFATYNDPAYPFTTWIIVRK